MATAIVALLDVPPLLMLPSISGRTVTSVASWCKALAIVPGFDRPIDAAAPTVRYRIKRDRPPKDMARLRAAIGVVLSTGRLMGRVGRTLAWRGRADGIALCGG